jgi:hypothetical protein
MLLEKLPREFLKFDLGPEIGNARTADGAMTSHGKNRGRKSVSNLGTGASHDQTDAQGSKKSTFQAIQFSVMDIVTKSFEMSKTGLGIS